MNLYYCGNQWGYTPIGSTLNIPSEYCNAPTDLQAVVTNQFVLLSWVAPHDYIHFIVEYRIAGSMDAWTIEQPYATSILLTLDASTEYEWRVRTVCSKDPERLSDWANGPNFTTGVLAPVCNPVSSVTVTNLGGGVFQASWPAAPGSSHYAITIEGGALPPQTFFTSGTTYNFTNLEENIQYSVFVTNICRGGVDTLPSPTVIFSTGFFTCPKVTGLNAQVNGTSIFATWFPPAIGINVGYNVYLNGTLVAANYNLTNITFTLLSEVSSYTIEVRTNCGTGFSDPASITVSSGRMACAATFTLTPASITANSFTLNWITALNGSTLSGLELVINNGNPIALAANVTTYNITGQPSGTIVDIKLYGICNNTARTGANRLLVPLLGNGALTFSPIVKSGGNMYVKWTPVADAIYYVIDDGTGEYRLTANEYTKFNVPRGVLQSFTVTAYAMINGTETAGTPVNTTDTYAQDNCPAYSVESISWKSATTAELIFSIAGAPFGGPIRIWVSNADQTVTYFQTIVYKEEPVLITGLTQGTTYDIAIYQVVNGNTDAAPTGDGCNAIQGTYTHDTCYIPGSANVLLTMPDSTHLEVALTGTSHQVSQTGYKIKWAYENGLETVWNDYSNGDLILFAAFPVSIVVPGPGMYKVQMAIDCDGEMLEWQEYKYSCSDVTSVEFAVNGNILTGKILPALLGQYKYSVQITALGFSDQITLVNSNQFTFQDLMPNRIYTAVVKMLCSDDNTVESGSFTFNFTTGSASSQICNEPSAVVYIENCSETTTPGDGNSTCSVSQGDWKLENAIIIPLGTDPENSLFLEATFSITINSISGAEVLFPGGVMGIIDQIACRPASSTVMTVELVTGAENLVTPSGTLATNGNITATGAYTSNGSTQLVIRVRGSYLKA